MAKRTTTAQNPNVDRRTQQNRRKDERRSKDNVAVATEQRKSCRRKVQRRRQIDPTTCERDYSMDEIEFMQALDEYKRANGRMFPTCSEILEVVRSLGYVRTGSQSDPGSPPDSEVAPAVDAGSDVAIADFDEDESSSV